MIKRFLTVALIFLLAVGFFPFKIGNVKADSLNIRPSDDAWVQAYNDNNFGSATSLQIVCGPGFFGNPCMAWLKFNLSSIPVIGIINNVTLNLKTSGSAGGYPIINVHFSSNTTWNESTITWNNQPSFNGLLDSKTVKDAETWFSWDVTSIVKSEYAGGNVIISFLVNATVSDTFAKFYSKEDVSANRPYLKVSYTLGTGGFSSLTKDGYVWNYSDSYATARNASFGAINIDSVTSVVGQRLYGDFQIFRSFLYFDTSLIPDSMIVVSAILSLYITDDHSNQDFYVTIQNGQPTYPHDPLENGDYNKAWYSGNGGSRKTDDGLSVNNYWNITFTVDGLDWISKTGTTKLCLRSDREINYIEPSDLESITFSSGNNASSPPKLYIKFNVPPDYPILNYDGYISKTFGTFTTTFSSQTSDGYLINSGANYDNVRNATSASEFDSDVLSVGQAYMVGPFYWFGRGVVVFDTSIISSNATIINATLSLYVTVDLSDDDFNVTIQNGQPLYPHLPVELADYYYALYSGNGGSRNSSTVVESQYWNITLTSDGCSWIQKDSITKLLLRSLKDIDVIAPTDYEEVEFAASEWGEAYSPKLYVTYIIGEIAYNQAWVSETGTVYDTSTLIKIGQSLTDANYDIMRSFLFFNTANLPAEANITQVILSLYIVNNYSTTDFNITIQNGGNYPHMPLVSGDYNKAWYSGNGGSQNTSTITGSGYVNITFNLDGISWISKQGITKLCLRSSRDISGIAPTGNETVEFYAYEATYDYAPKLYITYEIPPTPEIWALPMMFILGMIGLTGSVAGPMYAVYKFKKREYYEGFRTGLVVTALCMALTIAWLWSGAA